MLQKSQNIVRSLGTRRVTCRSSNTEDPQFCIGLWTAPLYGNLCKMIYAHISVSKRTDVMIMLKILGTTIPNLIIRVTRCPGIVHPCSNLSCHSTIKPPEHVAISCSGLYLLCSIHLYCGNLLLSLVPPIFCSLIN